MVLTGASERQAILEAVDVETRLRRLIQFCCATFAAIGKERYE